MTNLTAFKKGLTTEATKTFPKVAKRAQSDLAGRIYSGVILKTPVLTGHARHNWMPTVGGPLTEELEGVFGGDTTGDAFTGTEVTKMVRVQKELQSLPLGEAVYISNNVPYIELLEHGSSNKAPDGMVEISVMEALEVVQRERELDDSGN